MNDLINKFNTRLIANKNRFLKEVIEYYNINIDTYKKIVFYNISYNLDKIDREIIISTVKRSILNPQNLKYEYGTQRVQRFEMNQIKFYSDDFSVLGKEPEWGSLEFNEMILKRENQEYLLEKSFWDKPEHLKMYEECSDFNSFIDYVTDTDRLNDNLRKGYLINVNGWEKYIQKLVKSNFCQFPKSFYSNEKFICYKEIKSGYFIGLEYNINKYKKILKKGEIALPEDFILVYGDINEMNKSISLGILGNPLFFPPCFPLRNFASVEMFHNPDYINTEKLNYNVTLLNEGENMTKVIHPKEYSDKLKKHAFFYLHLLSDSSISYISYIENSLLESL